MRRLHTRLAAVAAVAVLAQPTPTPTGQGAEPPEPVPGEPVCSITDPRLLELSGLVAFDDGYAVVNDGTLFADRVGVFLLDQNCQVLEQIGYPSPPLDPEALAWDREADVLWVGDVGDNFETTGQSPRVSVAYWRIDLGGDRTPLIHRFTYPDGQGRDAEALVLDGDGTPVIVTKAVTGTAELFRPTELRPSSGQADTVPLEPVGEITLPEPETEVVHRLGAAGRRLVTGAANAPDGSAVVLRSYTDAFEYEVTDGDVVAALTDGEPLITPLPEEPLGEAISYTAEGERFLTVSEVPEESDYTPALLGYTPTPPPEPTSPPEPAAGTGSGSGGGGLFNDLQDILNLIAAVGVLGVLLVAAGVFGIVRARRARPGGGAASAAPPPGPATGRARLPVTPPPPPPGAVPPPGAAPAPGAEPGPPPGGVYTSSAAEPASPEYGRETEYGGRGTEYRGTEYGGRGGEYRGGEYGGGEYGGGEYGADRYRGGEYRDDGWSGYHGGEYPHPEHPYRGSEYRGAARPDHRYRAEGYPEGGYQVPFDQDRPAGYPEPPPEPAGYPGGSHHAGADYYSDDPDYPYVFRDRGGSSR